MSGVICIGIFLRATIPKTTVNITSAKIAIGLSMQSLIKFFIFCFS